MSQVMGSEVGAPSPEGRSGDQGLGVLVGLGLGIFLLAGGFERLGRVLDRLGERLTGRPRRRRYAAYTAETLRVRLDDFERQYGLSSEDFYERYRHGERLPAERAKPGLAGYDETVWSSLWREYLRVREHEDARSAVAA